MTASAELPPIRRIDRNKAEGYLLHPVNGHGKAQFFERFGFDRSRWHELRTALLEHATGGTVIERASSPYGVRYTVRGSIRTPSRQQPPTVCSVWQVDVGENAVRPITACPDLLPANVLHVREPSPPADTKPVGWFLLTTCTLDGVEDALACVRWYCLRWRIEDWHRVLKSGCAIEALAHKTRTRLERAIAIRLVTDKRIMLMTLLGRTCPELRAEVLFSDIEIEVLAAYAKKNDQPHPRLRVLRFAWSLDSAATSAVAEIRPPGHQVIWRGLAQLITLCEGFLLGKNSRDPINCG